MDSLIPRVRLGPGYYCHGKPVARGRDGFLELFKALVVEAIPLSKRLDGGLGESGIEMVFADAVGRMSRALARWHAGSSPAITPWQAPAICFAA